MPKRTKAQRRRAENAKQYRKATREEARLKKMLASGKLNKGERREANESLLHAQQARSVYYSSARSH